MERLRGDQQTEGNDGWFARFVKHLTNRSASASADPPVESDKQLGTLRQTRPGEAVVFVGQNPSQPTGSHPVNDGASSTSTKAINLDLTPTKTAFPIASGSQEQNDRRLSGTSVSPIDRYRSPLDSFPDYGPLNRKNNMAGRGVLRQLNALPGAIDTIGNPPSKPEKRAASILHQGTRGKRPRIDDGGASMMKQAKFGLREDPSQAVALYRQPAESIRSVRSTGEGSVFKQTAGSEFGNVEERHQGVRRSSRRQRSSTNQRRSDHDPINDDFTDDGRSDTRSGHAANRTTRQGSAHDNIFAVNAQRTQALQLSPGETDQAASTTARDSDMDELSPHFNQSLHLDPDTDNKPRGDMPSSQSASHATRGNIKPSKFAKQPSKNPIFQEGIPLQAAVCQPHGIYTDEGATPRPCRLRSGNDAFGYNTLYLVDAKGQPAHEEWFLIDASKIERARINREDRIMKMTVPVDLKRNTGKFVLLQFREESAWDAFTSWFGQTVNITVSGETGDRLGRELMRSYEEVSKHLKVRCARSAPTPVRSTRLGLPQPTDVGLMQHKQAVRQGRQYEASAYQHERPSKPARQLETLSSEFEPTHTNARSGIEESDKFSDDQEGLRRSARTARLEATVLRRRRGTSSSSPDPEPARWSAKNPDWAKNWRMPLAYQRTMVERDDIPRLDEGQCLNDNLIGFYLRYLYTKLEKEHPETAKRVYFHNSFFYEKLKPVTRGKINYEGVKNWTNKVDLLSYDYIVVPVNEHFHWWVAIICNPGRLDPDARKDEASSIQSPNEDNTVEIEATLADQDSTKVEATVGGDDAAVAVKSETEVPKAKEANILPEEDIPLVVSDILPPGETARDKGHGMKDTVTPSVDAANKDDSVIEVLDADQTAAPTNGAAPQQPLKPTKKLFANPVKKFDPTDPRIITLDSLGSAHSPVCQQLKQYLIAEFKDKRNKDVEYTKAVGLRANNLPEQMNFTDCGVYLLNYVEKFLEDPDKFVQAVMQKEQVDWTIDSSKSRNDIRDLIFKLHDAYQQEQDAIRQKKVATKQRKGRGKSELRSSVPPMSSPTPVSKQASPQPVNEQGPRRDAEHEVVIPGTPTPSPPQPAPKPEGVQKHDAETEKTGKPETINLDSPDVTDKPDALGAQKSPIPVPDSPPDASRPRQSIEVHPVKQVEVVLHQHPIPEGYTRVSPDLPIEVSDAMEPIELSDDKDVDLVGVGVRGASSPTKKRLRSDPADGHFFANHKRSRFAPKGSPDLGSSPPKPREVSHHFHKDVYEKDVAPRETVQQRPAPPKSPAFRPFRVELQENDVAPQEASPQQRNPVKHTYAGHGRRRRSVVSPFKKQHPTRPPRPPAVTSMVDLTEDD